MCTEIFFLSLSLSRSRSRAVISNRRGVASTRPPGNTFAGYCFIHKRGHAFKKYQVRLIFRTRQVGFRQCAVVFNIKIQTILTQLPLNNRQAALLASRSRRNE